MEIFDGPETSSLLVTVIETLALPEGESPRMAQTFGMLSETLFGIEISRLSVPMSLPLCASPLNCTSNSAAPSSIAEEN